MFVVEWFEIAKTCKQFTYLSVEKMGKLWCNTCSTRNDLELHLLAWMNLKNKAER